MVRYYMAEFVYQMIKARKAYGDRVILDDGPTSDTLAE